MATAQDYLRDLQALLPTGPAWPREDEAVLTQMLVGVAEEFARIDARAGQLVLEMAPNAASEMLSDWERVTALPDHCSVTAETDFDRQLAIAQKLAGAGGQTIATFQAMAGRLLYRAEIVEFEPLRAPFHADDPANGEEWAYAWLVEASNLDGSQAEAGQGGVDLECVIGRAAPAHTVVAFTYPAPPEPLLWFDFLES